MLMKTTTLTTWAMRLNIIQKFQTDTCLSQDHRFCSNFFFYRMPIKITLHILQKNEKKSFRLHSFSLITVNLVTNTQCRTHNIRSLKIFTFGVWIFSFRSGPDKQSSVKITNFRNNQKAKISMFLYKRLLKIPEIHDVQLIFSINCGREGQQWV